MLQSIGKDAFYNTQIEELLIPSTVTDLSDGCFRQMTKLTRINLMPNNNFYKLIDNKYLLGKSDRNQENFDVLLFCCPNVKQITIPSFIKQIAPYAFRSSEIETVKFDENSELEIFRKQTFSFSNLKSIKIPSNVSKICKKAFEQCLKIKDVRFEENSKLQAIEDETFSFSSLKHISIPSNVLRIGKRAFSWSKLKYLEFESNLKLQTIDDGAFTYSPLRNILIPASVSFIGQSCFHKCEQLENVIFECNSQLEKLDNAFKFCSSLKYISIPPMVQNIVFSDICCSSLRLVEIQAKSNIFTFENCKFDYCHSNLSIFVPANVKIYIK